MDFLDALEAAFTEAVKHKDLEPYDPMITRMEACKRNAEQATCDRCGVTGNRPNMMRWHFEKCKTVFRECQHCGNTIPRQGVKDIIYNRLKFCSTECYHTSRRGIQCVDHTPEVRKKISEKALERSDYYRDLIKKTKPWKVRKNGTSSNK